MNNDSKLTPKRRFPEFRKEPGWERFKLGDVAMLLKGKGISKAEIDPNGKRLCVRYGELYTRYGEVIDTVHSRTSANDADLFLSKANDVIIPASGETKMDIATASCVLHAGIALGSDLNVIRTSQDGVFLSYYINGKLRSEIAKVAQGDTVVHLYPSQLVETSLAIPALAEQRKIADCLSSLDDLIAAEGRKWESLRAYKKGLMQQLFPRDGESVPRMRFPEFRGKGEWEEKTIGGICKLKAGEFVSASAISDKFNQGRFPCYGGNGLRGYVQSFTHEGTFVLVGRQGALCGNVNLFHGKFHATEHALVVTPHEGVATNWLYYALGMLNLNRFSVGQAQPGLSVGVLDGIARSMPGEEAEQQRIADCLSSLDEVIASQSRKIERLKRHKKGLMQQLFPSSAEVEA